MTNFSALTDEQLVRAYAKGNNEAFDTLLRRHQDRIFSYILRIIKNEDIAKDIRQGYSDHTSGQIHGKR